MEQTQSVMGRPRTDGRASSAFRAGKLHAVLVERLPREFIRDNEVDAKKLSDQIGFVRYTVYRWLNTQSLSRKAIRALVKLSEETNDLDRRGALKATDLIEFFALDI